jgi:hypothetical protein
MAGARDDDLTPLILSAGISDHNCASFAKKRAVTDVKTGMAVEGVAQLPRYRDAADSAVEAT